MKWLLLTLLILTSGCGNPFRAPAITPPPFIEPVAREELKGETLDAKIRRLEAELKLTRSERDEFRLAGARRLLNWATGILALLAIGGVVATVIMSSKLMALAAIGCGAGAIMAQCLNQALDHLTLITWCTGIAVVLIGGYMAWRYHRD